MLRCKFCERECKNDNSLRNHQRLCKQNPDKQIIKIESAIKAAAAKTEECEHCKSSFSKSNIKKHVLSCNKNPKNLKTCSVCGTEFSGAKTTCSYSCSNTYFRSGENNGSHKKRKHYRTKCFIHHGKKCVVCGEEKIVAVHHFDHDHSNDEIENLIPLCPTHHQYVHSKYASEVLPKIEEYIEKRRQLRVG